MISPENKTVAIALFSLLAVLICAKLALWPWVIRRRTHRYRGIAKR
ncbi:hypothetical protein [Terriglobus tenax]|nr:hypothetical protein [Terriglobus tenax]